MWCYQELHHPTIPDYPGNYQPAWKTDDIVAMRISTVLGDPESTVWITFGAWL
jgi:hypothetical protein